MLTIVPLPRSTMDGSTAWHVWNAAVRSVPITSSHCVGLDLQERADLRQAGVVDQPVDPPEVLDHPRDQPSGLPPVGHVGIEDRAVGAGVADLRQGRPWRASSERW